MRAWPLFLALIACGGTPSAPGADPGEAVAVDHQTAAQAFLDEVTAEYVRLYAASSETAWASNTRIVEGDDTLVEAEKAAAQDLSDYLGSPAVLGKAREHLQHEGDLTDLQVRQLRKLIYQAAPNNIEHKELVARRIAASAEQTQRLYGFTFELDGKPVTPNAIDHALETETDLDRRRAVWESSKAIGPTLVAGMTELRDLRNETVRKAGYKDFYAYQASDYDLTSDEMDALLQRMLAELWPLYRELHTWARYELAGRYGTDVPELLPAHWLPNRWGQSWSSLVEVEGLDLDAAMADKTPEWVVKEGEAFYVSLGFEPLPQTFWDKSSLYPVPEGATYKKNTHASAWHMDLGDDVRSLMSVENNAEWFSTTNHELGHIYYYESYSRPEVPPLLREGANRAFHEAVGTQMGMAAAQRPQLIHRGLVSADAQVDQTQLLLKEALDLVVFMPFAAGTMTRFEKELYVDELPVERWNPRWWELAAHFQGIAPPAPRGPELADALTKTHINDDPAQYYDYALSTIILFQLHNHIAEQILHQDPRATQYWGSKETGAFLKGVLEVGATQDWDVVLKNATGSELSAKPMLAYYAPLMDWLQEQNEGRVYTLPEALPAL